MQADRIWMDSNRYNRRGLRKYSDWIRSNVNAIRPNLCWKWLVAMIIRNICSVFVLKCFVQYDERSERILPNVQI